MRVIVTDDDGTRKTKTVESPIKIGAAEYIRDEDGE
jgi:hypothetical protein